MQSSSLSGNMNNSHLKEYRHSLFEVGSEL